MLDLLIIIMIIYAAQKIIDGMFGLNIVYRGKVSSERDEHIAEFLTNTIVPAIILVLIIVVCRMSFDPTMFKLLNGKNRVLMYAGINLYIILSIIVEDRKAQKAIIFFKRATLNIKKGIAVALVAQVVISFSYLVSYYFVYCYFSTFLEAFLILELFLWRIIQNYIIQFMVCYQNENRLCVSSINGKNRIKVQDIIRVEREGRNIYIDYNYYDVTKSINFKMKNEDVAKEVIDYINDGA